MQYEPSRLLSNANSLAEFIGADSVFAVHQHPKSDEPFIKTNGRVLEDGSKLYGELLVALFAFPATLSLEVVVLFMTASRTLGTVRPAKIGHSLNAYFGIAEVLDGFLESFRFAVHKSLPLN